MTPDHEGIVGGGNKRDAFILSQTVHWDSTGGALWHMYTKYFKCELLSLDHIKCS